MALFSIVWKKIGQITHLLIYDGIHDVQIYIYIYIYMNKSMTVEYCLSQNNFLGGYVLPGTGGTNFRYRHFSVETCENERIGSRSGSSMPAAPPACTIV